MTSFSSSSTAHPTRRLSCSACTSELWPLALTPVTHQCPPPHPRGPPCTPGTSPSPCWGPCSLPGPWSCLGPGVLMWKNARGLGRAILLLLEAEAALGFALPPLRGPGALRLRGASKRSQEDPQQTGSLPPVSGFCRLPKQRGLASTVHHLPLGCMPSDHTYLRTKACTVCIPLAWPLTSSPGMSEAA